METSSSFPFFKEVVVRLVFLTVIRFCSDCLGICMQLGENSCLLLQIVIRQTGLFKQTFIQIKSVLCKRMVTVNSIVAMLFFSLARGRFRICLLLIRAPSRAQVSFSCDCLPCVCLCICSQLISVSST